jgi:hypothetical protein
MIIFNTLAMGSEFKELSNRVYHLDNIFKDIYKIYKTTHCYITIWIWTVEAVVAHP